MTKPILISLALVALGFGFARAQDDVASLYEAARKAEAARDFRAAYDLYDRILELDEEHEDAFERWEACGELAAWQEGLEGKPTAMDLVRLGEAFLAAGRLAEERAAYEEAIALDPDCAEAHGHLALAHYGYPDGSMPKAVEHTARFLAASPHRDVLARARADFDVYGRLRIMRAVLGRELAAAGAARARSPVESAKILEAAAAGEIPDAYRTVLLAEAGKLRFGAKDVAGARSAFERALTHASCRSTIDARLGLAAIAVGEKDLPAALDHLKAAVAEGSGACPLIAEQKDGAFAPLFADEALRAEVEALTGMEEGDAPIRARIQAAVAKANEEGKTVLLYWYGPYCPFVMAMEERLAHPEVKKLLDERFVVVRVDYGAHHRAMAVDADYGGVFEAFGVPCFMALDRGGSIEEILRDSQVWEVERRSYDAGAVVEWLSEILDRME